jgi:hypothetical protein
LPTDPSVAPPPGSKAMTLILFEDVDLVFERKPSMGQAPRETVISLMSACMVTEDAGFHHAILELMRTAKCPIVLTANNPPPNITYRCLLISATRPTAAELAGLLASIWAAENLPPIPAEVFLNLSKHFKCDIRASILALQVWAPSILSRGCRLSQRISTPEPEPAMDVDESVVVVDESLPSTPDNPVPNPGGETPRSESELQFSPPRQPLRNASQDSTVSEHLLGFAYPAIEGLSPHCGPVAGGTRVRIWGRNFAQTLREDGGPIAAVEVLLGRDRCTDVKVLSDTELEAVTPPSTEGRALVPVVVRLYPGYVTSGSMCPKSSQPIFLFRDPGDEDIRAHFPPVMNGRGKPGSPVNGDALAAAAALQGPTSLGSASEEAVEEMEEQEHPLEDFESSTAEEALEKLQSADEDAHSDARSENRPKRRRILVEDEDEDDEGRQHGGESERLEPDQGPSLTPEKAKPEPMVQGLCSQGVISE